MKNENEFKNIKEYFKNDDINDSMDRKENINVIMENVVNLIQSFFNLDKEYNLEKTEIILNITKKEIKKNNKTKKRKTENTDKDETDKDENDKDETDKDENDKDETDKDENDNEETDKDETDLNNEVLTDDETKDEIKKRTLRDEMDLIILNFSSSSLFEILPDIQLGKTILKRIKMISNKKKVEPYIIFNTIKLKKLLNELTQEFNLKEINNVIRDLMKTEGVIFEKEPSKEEILKYILLIDQNQKYKLGFKV